MTALEVPPYYRAPGPDVPQPGYCMAGHDAAVTWAYGDPEAPRRICVVHLVRFRESAWTAWLLGRLFGRKDDDVPGGA